jgi:hypothetical protein
MPNPQQAIEQAVNAPVQAPPVAPAPAPETGAAPAPPAPDAGGGGATLPDELIQMPIMQALVSGQPGAVSDSIETGLDTPFGQAIAQFGPQMQDAGFGFYRSNDGALGVVFNRLHVNGQDVVDADNNGTLLEIAPPVSQVEGGLLSDPQSNPALGEAQVPSGPAMAGGAGQPAQGGVPPAQNQNLDAARRKNIQPQGPTDQPRPGAGKILNSILKPVI